MRKLWYGLAACALAAVTALPAATAAQGGSSKLSKEDHGAIAGKSGTVTLLVASKPGANGALASELKSLGGDVRYRDDQLDYLRVNIAAAKADAVGQLACVQASTWIDPPPAGPASGARRPSRRWCRSRRRAPRRLATTRTCRSATPAPRSSSRRTRPGTAAASRSASSTPASRSTTRACSRPAPASERSSTG